MGSTAKGTSKTQRAPAAGAGSRGTGQHGAQGVLDVARSRSFLQFSHQQ